MPRLLVMLSVIALLGAGVVIGSEGDGSTSAQDDTDTIQSGVIVDCEIYVTQAGEEQLISRPQVQLSRPEFKSPATCGAGTRDEKGNRLNEAAASLLLVAVDREHVTLEVTISHFKRFPSIKETRTVEFRETIDLGEPHEFAIPCCKEGQNLLRVVLIPRLREDEKLEE